MHPTRQQRSYLFTLRMWEEQEWREERVFRIKVQHVLSGEVRYFRNWADVLAFLMSIVEKEGHDPLNGMG